MPEELPMLFVDCWSVSDISFAFSHQLYPACEGDAFPWVDAHQYLTAGTLEPENFPNKFIIGYECPVYDDVRSVPVHVIEVVEVPDGQDVKVLDGLLPPH